MLNRVDISIIIFCLATLFAGNVLIVITLLQIKDVLSEKIEKQKIINALIIENINRIANFLKGDLK